MSKAYSDGLCRGLSLACGLLLAACATAPLEQRSSPSPGPAVVDANLQAEFERGVGLMKAEDWSQATVVFTKLAAEHPRLPGPRVNLGLCQWHGGDANAARVTLQAVATEFPQYPAAAEQLGRLLRSLGDFAGADEAYRKALDANPDHREALYNRAVLNDLYLQRPELALSLFTHFLQLEPENTQVERYIADLKRRVPAQKGESS